MSRFNDGDDVQITMRIMSMRSLKCLSTLEWNENLFSSSNDFRRYAMTAMHCVEEASSLVVALGEHNIRADIENHQAKVVFLIMTRWY